MIRRPPRSTLDRSSAASDVYKRQGRRFRDYRRVGLAVSARGAFLPVALRVADRRDRGVGAGPVSYTHLRAHETVLDLVCRLLLDKKESTNNSKRVLIPHHAEAHHCDRS